MQHRALRSQDVPLSPVMWQCVPACTAPSAHCPLPSGTPKHPPSSIFTAPSQRVLVQRGRQLGKAVCSLEKAAFSPKVWLILSGRGTGLIQLTLHWQNCLQLQEKQQKGHRVSKGGKEGGMLSGQSNPSLPTDTYCTAAINHSPFGHRGERQIITRQSPKASRQRARLCLGCLSPTVLSPNLGNPQRP